MNTKQNLQYATFWYKNGQLHREDGPAVEWDIEDEYWQAAKKSNRGLILSGPANSWYKNGKRHREDGPAIEWADGAKQWWLDDKKLTYEEFLVATLKPSYLSPFTGKRV